MKYRFDIPGTSKMSPISFTAEDRPTETAYQNALWHYNSARAHDGLGPLSMLPAKTRKTLIN